MDFADGAETLNKLVAFWKEKGWTDGDAEAQARKLRFFGVSEEIDPAGVMFTAPALGTSSMAAPTEVASEEAPALPPDVAELGNSAASGLDVEKYRRDRLGRWAPSGGDEYWRTTRIIVERVQALVATSLRNCHAGTVDFADEAETLRQDFNLITCFFKL